MITCSRSIAMRGTKMIEKTPEDEAFEEIERRQGATGWRKAQIARLISVDDAFLDYCDEQNMEPTSERRRFFQAGWVSGVRNEWRKERND